MKTKTSKLMGAALDWAVALVERYTSDIRLDEFKQWEDLGRTQVHDDDYTYWSPSTDWAQGGPIIERERLCLNIDSAGVWVACTKQNYDDEPRHMVVGATPLEAAMRCFCQSELGDDVVIPDELLRS